MTDLAADATRSVPEHRSRGLLVVMVGAPGTGKSYFAQQVAALLRTDVLQTDEVRKQLFPEPRYTPDEMAKVYGVCHRRIALLLARGRRVLFDATNLQERNRKRLYAFAEQYGADLLVVVVRAPEDVIRARLVKRQTARDPGDFSDADWDVYRRLAGTATPVRVPHVLVNTAVSFRPALQLLHRLALPPELDST